MGDVQRVTSIKLRRVSFDDPTPVTSEEARGIDFRKESGQAKYRKEHRLPKLSECANRGDQPVAAHLLDVDTLKNVFLSLPEEDRNLGNARLLYDIGGDVTNFVTKPQSENRAEYHTAEARLKSYAQGNPELLGPVTRQVTQKVGAWAKGLKRASQQARELAKDPDHAIEALARLHMLETVQDRVMLAAKNLAPGEQAIERRMVKATQVQEDAALAAINAGRGVSSRRAPPASVAARTQQMASGISEKRQTLLSVVSGSERKAENTQGKRTTSRARPSSPKPAPTFCQPPSPAMSSSSSNYSSPAMAPSRPPQRSLSSSSSTHLSPGVVVPDFAPVSSPSPTPPTPAPTRSSFSSSSSSTSSSSSGRHIPFVTGASSAASGGTFYPGGRFVPGEGRAPKGGGYY